MQPVVEAVAAADRDLGVRPGSGVLPALPHRPCSGRRTRRWCDTGGARRRPGRRCLAVPQPVRPGGSRRLPRLDRPVGPDRPCRRPAGGLGAAHPRAGSTRRSLLRGGVPPALPAARCVSAAGGWPGRHQPRPGAARVPCRRGAPTTIGAVFSAREGGRFVPLAVRGAERVDWDAPDGGNGTAACASRIASMARLGHRFSCRCAWAAGPPAWWRWKRHTSFSDESIAVAAASRPRSSVATRNCRALRRDPVDRHRRGEAPAGPGDPRRHRPGAGVAGIPDGRPHRSGPPGVRRRPGGGAARTAPRAHPDHQRAAAVDLRPSLRSARRCRPGFGAVGLRSSGGNGLAAHRPPDPRTKARPDSASRPRPNSCVSPRRRSPMLVVTQVPRTSG